MDAIDAVRRATDEYRGRLRLVHTASQWASATPPCAEWTVRDVADHIGGNRFTVLILGGLAPGDAMNRVTRGDFAGEPVRAFEDSAAAQLSALGLPGVLERVDDHPVGRTPVGTSRDCE